MERLPRCTRVGRTLLICGAVGAWCSVLSAQTPGPAITGFNPNPLVVGGQQTVRILGSGFLTGGVQSFLLSTVAGSAQLTLPTPNNFVFTGVSVVGPGIPAGTTVTAFRAPIVFLSAAATATQSNVPITFGNNCPTAGAPPAFVLWGTANVTVTLVTATEIDVLVPANLQTVPGVTVTVNLFNLAGGEICATTPATASRTEGIGLQPALSTMNPSSATACTPAAFNMTMNGSNFQTVTGFTARAQFTPPGISAAPSQLNPLPGFALTAAQMTVSVPPNLVATVGTGSVVAENPTSTSPVDSSTQPFTVTPTPSVTAANPNQIQAGSGDTTVTLTVRNYVSGVTRFRDATTGTTMPVIGTPATGATSVQVTVISTLLRNAGTILQVIAVNFDGANPNGTAYSANCETPFGITVTAPAGPSLTAINPNLGTACGPDFPITLTGTNFQSGSRVQFAGTLLTPGTTPTATQMIATVPASLIGSPGTANVAAGNPSTGTTGFLFSTTQPYTIRATPVIQGQVGLNTAGATATLQLTVANYVPGTTQVRIGLSGQAPNTILQPIGTIPPGTVTFQVIVPGTILQTAGTYQVVVVNLDQANLNGTPYPASCSPPATVTIGKPSLTSVDPGAATVCGPNFSLTVNGSGFVANTVVGFGYDQTALNRLSTTSQTATQVKANITTNLFPTSGTARVAVANPQPDGTDLVADNVIAFPINATPTIQAIGPASVQVGSPSFPLTVGVTNYIPNVTRIKWSTTLLTETNRTVTGSLTNVTVTVPANVIPTTAGGTVTVSVVNVDNSNPGGTSYAASCSAGSSTTVSITPATAAPTISSRTLPVGMVGQAYPANITFTAQGGRGSYTWTMTGQPTGLTVNQQTGALAGTPSVAGNFTLHVTVTDQSTPTALSGTQDFPLTVLDALKITTTSLPDGVVNVNYTGPALAATGGQTPYTWSATGLPSSFSINPQTGVISGSSVTASTINIVLAVSESSPYRTSTTASVSLRINAGIGFSPSTLPAAEVGKAYSVTFAAAGTSGTLVWSQTGLPQPFSLNSSTGVLSGTPTAPGTINNIRIGLADGGGQTLVQTYSLTVNLPATPTVQITVPQQPRSVTDQPTITMNLGSGYPLDLDGVLTLSFSSTAPGLPATGYVSPGVAFALPIAGSNGLRTAIRIPAGQSTFTLPANNPISVGSVTGTITVALTSLTVTSNGTTTPVPLPSPIPSVAILVPTLAPSIDAGSVRIINKTNTGFTVELKGLSTTRDLVSAHFTFTAASGTQLTGSTDQTVTYTTNTAARDWFASGPGQAGGSTFDLQVPFPFTGDSRAIGTVQVTLRNSTNADSNAVTGQ